MVPVIEYKARLFKFSDVVLSLQTNNTIPSSISLLTYDFRIVNKFDVEKFVVVDPAEQEISINKFCSFWDFTIVLRLNTKNN